eukprot:4895979-Pyramimonas_sp.AAC.1
MIWASSGPPGGPVGGLWGRPGPPWAVAWLLARLTQSEAVLGASLDRLEAPWNAPGPPWKLSWACQGPLG